jgi:hypothetical protein
MKDFGDLHFFLGMEVERDRAQRWFYINQIGYLKEILKHFRMEDCKAIGVPLDPKSKLKKNENKDVEMVKVPYQQALGYWKELENKQEMKHSRFMKWNNCIN